MFSYQFGFATINSDSTKIKYSLGVTPSAILNVVPAIQLSHEISFSKFLSFGLETGFIVSHLNKDNQDPRGLRLRPQLNFTIHDQNNFNVDLYLFYNYRYFHATRVDEVRRANGAFTEEIRGDRNTTMSGFGLGVNFGFKEFDSILKKVNVGFGIGYGSISNRYSEEIFNPEFLIFSDFSQSGIAEIPILILHFSMDFI